MKSLRKIIREQVEKVIFEQDEDPTQKLNDKISSQQDNLKNLKNLQSSEAKKKNDTPQNAVNNPELKKFLSKSRDAHDAKAAEYNKEIKDAESDIDSLENIVKSIESGKSNPANPTEQSAEDLDAQYQKKLDNILNKPI